MRSDLVMTCVLLLIPAAASAQAPGNLLRNGDFQDDWITLLPENKNHHWCYASDLYHRRDFNPDGWNCQGSWQWQEADAPAGQRRLILHGPTGEITQRVNWVAIHDDRGREGFPDAGGFPGIKPQRSLRPLRLVRDLTFRVRVRGQGVPAKAGSLTLGFSPPGSAASAEPFGSTVPATVAASAPLPEGTFDWRWLEVKLPATAWLQAVEEKAGKDPKEKAVMSEQGPILPGTVGVGIRYQAKEGQIEVGQAELFEPGPASANLLPNGGFEGLSVQGYPVEWSQPAKYRYFPPGHYYIFNTWHNSRFPNRGPTAVDPLVTHAGKHSLRMIVAAGDEQAVSSGLVDLFQDRPRLIEAQAWVKTDRLCMLQLDAVNEKGQRLDGFNFIHKAPLSVGTNDWRLVRQVFRPREPVRSIRLMLCARGVNGYTLDDTGWQPQNNVCGTVWWDEVRLFEPESTTEELAARGVKPAPSPQVPSGVHLEKLDLGERLLGENFLHAVVVSPNYSGPCTLTWEFTSPSGKTSQVRSEPLKLQAGGQVPVRLPYLLTEPCPTAYTEYRGDLSLADGKGQLLGSSDIWFGTWTVPIDLELGALYLTPEQKQLVRLNLGLSAASMARLAKVRLEVVRRGTREVLRTTEIAATPAAITAQRQKIPIDLREDFRNLLLADLDVSFLPVQPFRDPQRNWLVRAVALDAAGKEVARAESPPFCRLAHEPAQPPIQTVTIKAGTLHVNGQPWLPWGAVYGHVPVFAGPADPGPGKYRDLSRLPAWGIYDRFTAAPYTRRDNDFNCMRYVAGSISDIKVVEKRWQEDNLICSTAFAVPHPVFSMEELHKQAGGKAKLDAYLDWCRKAPMVASVTPGIEEAFGLFQGATPAQLQGLEQVVNQLRQQTGKPVMVGHGGYWNRFEFEKVPFFDIFDPETEPLYPANLHTDLTPLLGRSSKKSEKTIWLRPQMYEDVPYERWRFHVHVELMRGARGWQVAHGPGDASLFRGLHGELEFLKPILVSPDAVPAVTSEPPLEHWSRRHSGKLYVMAATTRGMGLGHWRTIDEAGGSVGRPRVTEAAHEHRDEANAYAIGQAPESGPSIHGVQYLPLAQAWPAGTRLVQWVRLDPRARPSNLVVLVKADGRWTHAASWGKFDTGLLKRPEMAYWFLNSFYRHAKGFLGWDTQLVERSRVYLPARSIDQGALPAAGSWVRLELPLDKIGAADNLLDGVGFWHEGGRVFWGRTSLVAPDGKETIIWGDALHLPAEQLARTRIRVPGLKAGTKVRVLFEDRELRAEDGGFVDDFRGQDLYQRFGGGPGVGYGDAPVALHLYEIPLP